MAARRKLRVFCKWPRYTLRAAAGAYLVCILLLPCRAHALDPNKQITQYLHTSWRIQDGSVPAGMQAVSQSPDGFLWFTSTNQAYRFDGVRFVPWLPTTGTGAIEGILAVFGDHTGGLWALGIHEITHVKAGIVLSHLLVEGRLYPLGAVVSDDLGGSLWIVQSGLGDVPALCHVNDHGIQCLGKADGITIPGAYSLLADGKGGFWLGGLGSIIHWSAGVSEVFRVTSRSELGARVISMAQGPDGSLWAGMLGKGLGLVRLTNGVFRPFVTSGFDGRELAVTGMTFDRDGSLWVATATQGLFRIHSDAVDHYGRIEGLSGDNVQALVVDREGLLWVATTNGIDSFRDPFIATFSAAEGLASDLAQGVLASKDGSVWVADGESLDHLEHGKFTSIRYGSGLPGDQVSAMLEDRAGNLWVGVFNGLYLVKNGNFRRIPEPNGRACGLVMSITEDTEGSIWGVCVGPPWKLVRIRDFQIREEFTEAQIPKGNHVAADPREGIWLGTSQGQLVHLRHGTVEKFSLNEKKNSGSPRIVVAGDGSVLAGFNDGLVGWRNGKVQRMSIKNGLPCDQIFSFLEDREKRWWLYTDCGVVELPDSELQRWWANPETVVQTRLYDVLDGARPGGYAFFNAGAYSPDGHVWFANGSAVQVLDPSRLSQRALPAMTYIESITVDRKEFAETTNLTLAPHPRDLQIDYTSPTLLIPQRVKFRYRLDGYDHDWHEAGTRRQAFYTDLPPGRYTFRVIAANSDGVWNSRGAKLEFSVAPAYYETNWFRALCVVFLVALLWAAYQLRVRQLQREFTMALEARVGERTRIARELHDTLLQSLHGVLFRFQAARNLLPSQTDKAMEVLDVAIVRTEKAIAEGRDTIGGLRSDAFTQGDFPELLKVTGIELTRSPEHDGESPSFSITVEGEQRILTSTVQEESYQIARELLRNAFHHANASRIEADLRYDHDVFRLRIRDNGNGLDLKTLEERHDGHWGLRGARERAERIGAKLDFWSEAGAGTEVELSVPAPLAYTGSRDTLLSRLLHKVRRYEYRN